MKFQREKGCSVTLPGGLFFKRGSPRRGLPLLSVRINLHPAEQAGKTHQLGDNQRLKILIVMLCLSCFRLFCLFEFHGFRNNLTSTNPNYHLITFEQLGYVVPIAFQGIVPSKKMKDSTLELSRKVQSENTQNL